MQTSTEVAAVALKRATVIFACSFPLLVSAQNTQEGVFLDPQTGDYGVRFLNEADGTHTKILVEGIFYPSTKIHPVIQSKFHVTRDGVAYRYKVRNDKTSKQDIEQLTVYVSSASSAGHVAPTGWSGSVTANGNTGQTVSWFSRMTRPGMDEVMDMNDVRWKQPAKKGIAPGGHPVEFAIKSTDLPGIGIIRYRGAAAVTMLPGQGPDPESAVGSALQALEQNDFVSGHAAVPKIPLSTPFNSAAVLTCLRAHLNGDIVKMALVDPALAAQFDRALQVAIEAAKRGNTDALRTQLKGVRQLLKKEHGDVDRDGDADYEDDKKGVNKRIDKLAARVLDFDVKYVLKQVNPGNKDE